jgi:TrmH family RNA methyltransferase
VDRRLEEYVDDHVTIPMPGGTESLNVSVTVALLMYERIRQGSLRGNGEFDYNIK